MKLRHFIDLSVFGLKTIFLRYKKPILGTIILTDYCNLKCSHCAVNNINKVIYPYEDIKRELQAFYKEGIRILFFCGGETLLWKDGNKDIRHLIREAGDMGFFLINIVTNGTIYLDIPEADVIFLSIDGMKETHNAIRGDTFDTIMHNVKTANGSNICVYMAVNNMNYLEIPQVCAMVRENPNIKSISFNFHTPYEGTGRLSLTSAQKTQAVDTIRQLIKQGYPIFNLYTSLEHFLRNDWSRPCYQCIVSENNRRYICGRCSEIDGLCHECGYLFAVEFSLLFKGNIKIIFEMLKTYMKFV